MQQRRYFKPSTTRGEEPGCTPLYPDLAPMGRSTSASCASPAFWSQELNRVAGSPSESRWEDLFAKTSNAVWRRTYAGQRGSVFLTGQCLGVSGPAGHVARRVRQASEGGGTARPGERADPGTARTRRGGPEADARPLRPPAPLFPPLPANPLHCGTPHPDLTAVYWLEATHPTGLRPCRDA